MWVQFRMLALRCHMMFYHPVEDCQTWKTSFESSCDPPGVSQRPRNKSQLLRLHWDSVGSFLSMNVCGLLCRSLSVWGDTSCLESVPSEVCLDLWRYVARTCQRQQCCTKVKILPSDSWREVTSAADVDVTLCTYFEFVQLCDIMWSISAADP